MRNLTKNAMAMMFVNMCEDVQLKDIRIKDFIKYADISKQTFYNYFRDKADIMNFTYELAVQQVINNMDASVHGAYYGALKMAILCRDNRKFYTQLARYETQNSFIQHFIRVSEDVYKKRLVKNQDTGIVDNQISQIIHIYCVGICTYFTEWIQDGMKDSPEQIAETIIASMPASIKEILESD